MRGGGDEEEMRRGGGGEGRMKGVTKDMNSVLRLSQIKPKENGGGVIYITNKGNSLLDRPTIKGYSNVI